MNIDKIINIVRALNEEGAIANVVGGGQIAGTAEAGDDPPVRKKPWNKGKKYMKCVKDDSGYKRIHWGQKGAKASSGNSKRKKAFRARHKCSSAKSNTPRGQACKDW